MLAPRAVKRKTTAKASSRSGVDHATPAAASAVDAAVPSGSESIDTGSEAVPSIGTVNSIDAAAPEESALMAADAVKPQQVTGGPELEASMPVQNGSEPQDPQQQKTEKERLALLRYTLEESMSDWGLSYQHPELLKRLEASKTGYVHISNLLSLPAIARLTTVMADVTTALRSEPSDALELDETGFQVKRKITPDYEELAKISEEDWAKRTFYLENIPKPPKGKSYNLFTLRTFLASLFDSSVDAVRLPSLYTSTTKDEEGKKASTASTSAAMDKKLYLHETRSTVASSVDETGVKATKVKHQYAMPLNGGPFKGFAFVVVRDVEKAQQAQKRWSWDTKGKRAYIEPDETQHGGAEESDHDMDEDDGVQEALEAEDTELEKEDAVNGASTSSAVTAEVPTTTITSKQATLQRTPQEQADKSGLCAMSIEQFNGLRLEYLRYQRDITTLKDKQEAQNEYSSSRQQRRSVSPPWSKGRRKEPSPERWERKPRSPSPGRWVRKPLSPERDKRPARRYDDAQDDDYPRGCVCFIKRLHPDARSGTLKALFQSILEVEEVSPKDHLQHVDHKRNVDSCHVRFSEPATASFFASYFCGNPRYCHIDPKSTDPSEALAAVKKGENIRPIEAEVISGTPEAIYWSTVPKGIKSAYEGATKKENGTIEAESSVQTTIIEVAPLQEGDPSEEGTTAEVSRKRPLVDADGQVGEGEGNSKQPKRARIVDE